MKFDSESHVDGMMLLFDPASWLFQQFKSVNKMDFIQKRHVAWIPWFRSRSHAKHVGSVSSSELIAAAGMVTRKEDIGDGRWYVNFSCT